MTRAPTNNTVLFLLSSTTKVLLLFVLLIVTASLLSSVVLASAVHGDLLDASSHHHLVSELRGDDNRLFRHDATDHTKMRQANETICGKDVMDGMMQNIVAWNKNNKKAVEEESGGSNIDVDHNIGMALEYITFCVTDNPGKRGNFASYRGIHEAVIQLLDHLSTKIQTEDTTDIDIYTLTMALHVVYITSFANAVNHQAYIYNGAVTQLINVITSTIQRHELSEEDNDGGYEMKYPSISMWANAALSNLAASYCDTSSSSPDDDGRCYYYWTERGLELDTESSPLLLSDGSVAREIIVREGGEAFIRLLSDLACQGPVSTDDGDDNSNYVVMAGVNAEIYRDEGSWTIVPWSAASALKNIAIDPSSHPFIEPSVHCFCYLQQSNDWLEAVKGEQVIRHLRRGNPCYFSAIFDDEDSSEEEDHEPAFLGNQLCVDRIFYHADGHTCSDYGEEPSEDDCTAVDRNNVAASTACCGCGGGDIFVAEAAGGDQEEEEEEVVEDEL